MSIIIKGMDAPRFCAECPLKESYANTELFVCLPRHAFIRVNLYTGLDNDCPIRPAKTIGCEKRVTNEMAFYAPNMVEDYVKDGLASQMVEFIIKEDLLPIQKTDRTEQQESVYTVMLDVETKRKGRSVNAHTGRQVAGAAEGGGDG